MTVKYTNTTNITQAAVVDAASNHNLLLLLVI